MTTWADIVADFAIMTVEDQYKVLRHLALPERVSSVNRTLDTECNALLDGGGEHLRH